MSETIPDPAPPSDRLASTAAPQPPAPPPTVLQLFITFATISLSGFGGVMYWSRRMLVEQRKWMTAEEFANALALCQVLPGPTIINLSVVFGRSIRGLPGAAVAIAGLIGPGMLIVIVFAFLYAQYGNLDALQRMFTGVAAAAAGLVISLTARMAEPLWHERNLLVHAVAIATFVGVGVLRWPIWWVLAVLIPASIAVAWWSRR
jgi:chromate transporter